MDFYRLVLFVHVVSMTTMFATLALEWVSLIRLRSVSSYEEARTWAAIWGLLLPVGAPALFATLGSGVYMATVIGGLALPWVWMAPVSLVLVAIAGALMGPRRNRLRAAVGSGAGALPGQLREQFRHTALLASLEFRSAVLLTLLFGMVVRPASMGIPFSVCGAGLIVAWAFASQSRKAALQGPK
jgi:hypothetical protein